MFNMQLKMQEPLQTLFSLKSKVMFSIEEPAKDQTM